MVRIIRVSITITLWSTYSTPPNTILTSIVTGHQRHCKSNSTQCTASSSHFLLSCKPTHTPFIYSSNETGISGSSTPLVYLIFIDNPTCMHNLCRIFIRSENRLKDANETNQTNETNRTSLFLTRTVSLPLTSSMFIECVDHIFIVYRFVSLCLFVNGTRMLCTSVSVTGNNIIVVTLLFV